MLGTIKIIKVVTQSKGNIVPREVEEFKSIRGYVVKYFIFYYNT